MSQLTFRRRGLRGAFLLVAPAPARSRIALLALVFVSLGLAVAAGQVHGGLLNFPPRADAVSPAVDPALPPAANPEMPIRKLLHGDRTRSEIALTFDDGPNPTTTPLLLTLLRIYRVRATFFLIGANVRRYPELARQMVADGHVIGNHTEHHARLLPLDTAQVQAEIAGCDLTLRHVGVTPHLFRPPGGRYDRRVAGVAAALGYTLVQWTVNPGDYTRPGADAIAARVLDTTTNGDIILLHDSCEQTLTALPRILATLQQGGYSFITVDEMLRQPEPQAPASPNSNVMRL